MLTELYENVIDGVTIQIEDSSLLDGELPRFAIVLSPDIPSEHTLKQSNRLRFLDFRDGVDNQVLIIQTADSLCRAIRIGDKMRIQKLFVVGNTLVLKEVQIELDQHGILESRNLSTAVKSIDLFIEQF